MPASGNVWVDIFYLAALGLSVVGPLLYRIVGTRGLRARLRRPPTEISALKIGQEAVVVGRVAALPDEPELQAPISARSCVLWEVEARSKYGPGRAPRVSSVDFLLESGDGSILVRTGSVAALLGDDFFAEITPTITWDEGGIDALAARLRLLGGREPIPEIELRTLAERTAAVVGGDPEEHMHSGSVAERLVCVGDRVTVCGVVELAGDAARGVAAAALGRDPYRTSSHALALGGHAKRPVIVATERGMQT